MTGAASLVPAQDSAGECGICPIERKRLHPWTLIQCCRQARAPRRGASALGLSLVPYCPRIVVECGLLGTRFRLLERSRRSMKDLG